MDARVIIETGLLPRIGNLGVSHYNLLCPPAIRSLPSRNRNLIVPEPSFIHSYIEPRDPQLNEGAEMEEVGRS